MDTSKEYIKMCEKVEEIQTIKLPRNYNDIKSYWYEGIPNVWLPRQDQLQGMLWTRNDEYEHWISKLHDYILGLPFEELSMEQLWLAFVMKEKYNKMWNGEEWVSQNI